MSALELKQRIIKQVNSINDQEILLEIQQLLNVETTQVYELTREEVKAIEAGLEDVKQGRVYTSEQANTQIKEWLKK